MEKATEIRRFLKEIKKPAIARWIDGITFPNIMIVWIIIIIFFGIAYFFFENNSSFLLNVMEGTKTSNLRDAIYFSFVAATTTGFGDIVPFGYFKVIAVFEVVFGLLLLAIVTSKLISIKQDIILSELYEISSKERINRIRSSLLLFRQGVEKMITKIEGNSIQKREIANLYSHISSLEETLSEILNLIANTRKSHFIRRMDSINAELVFNSINTSLEKLRELLDLLEQKKVYWKSEINLLVLKKCIMVNENLFNQIASSGILPMEKVKEIVEQKNQTLEKINKSHALAEKLNTLHP